ncbi:MAG TPA: T9SS type A sorting domain-containing protein [Mucilaginibacter sp.]|jgi:sugar lactone lactonase YvrE
MKSPLHSFIIVLGLIILSQTTFGQAPNINYNTPTNVYIVSTAISPSLVPNNTGGAVPANTYATVTTPVANGTIHGPFAVATDGSGNVYVADYYNNKIRKYTSAGAASTVYGNGTAGTVNGTGAIVQFNNPQGLAYDGTNLFVADGTGNTIRKIVLSTGAVSTYAGSGASTSVNGTTLLNSSFNSPEGLDFDASGNLFIAEFGGNRIREISAAGVVTTLAGSGTATLTNGVGTAAAFNTPIDLVADGSGNVFVADYANNVIRKIVVSSKVVTTFAAGFSQPASICLDASGNLLVADQGSGSIQLITPAGAVSTIAGSGSQSDANGVGTGASFAYPVGIEGDGQGNFYVTDWVGTSTTGGSLRKMVLTGYTISPTTLFATTNLSFSGTTGTISGTTGAAAVAATNYTITGYNASGSSSFTISIAIGKSYAWTGKTNTSWTTASNWSPATVPGTNDAVSIGVSAYTNNKKEPTIAGTVTVGSITFGNSSATGLGHSILTVNGTLNVGGYVSIPNGITPVITGTGDVNIMPGAQLFSIATASTGVLTDNLSGTFTLQSDATGSASVGQITTSSIAGSGADSIHVERFIQGGAGYRGYRAMSSPVYTNTVSPNNIYTIKYLKNAGVYLTGGTSTGGFDKSGNPTLYLYREDQIPASNSFTSGNFWGITKINNTNIYDYYLESGSTAYNIPVGNGFLLFFRGARNSALIGAETVSTYVPQSATVTASGTLNAGPITVHNWYTPASANLGYSVVGVGTGANTNYAVRGFNFVGNPYACSIDWDTFNAAAPVANSAIYGVNVGNTIYQYNSNTNSYSTYQANGGSTNNGQSIIPSGTGFFVLASVASPSLKFTEAAKANVQNTGLNLFMATKSDVALVTKSNINQHLRVQLALDSINTDDIYIGFNEGASTGYVFNEDAPYKTGAGKVSLTSISSDNISLAINKLPLPKLKPLAIKLFVTASAYGTYKLNLTELKGIPELYEIWLMDNYKKDSLDLRHKNTYSFDINTDTGSYGSRRFQLVIRQNQVLALHLTSFTATKESDGAQLIWKTENEQNYTYFTIEKSTDGNTFNVLGGFSSGSMGTYSLLDKDAFPIGTTAVTDKYRLKMEDINGTISYSEIATLNYSVSNKDNVNNNLVVYPNPAASSISVTINPSTVSLASNLSTVQLLGTTPNLNTAAGSPVYSINIINITGAIVKAATFSSNTWQGNVSNLSPGTYIIQVTNKNNKSLVGKGTFVKL